MKSIAIITINDTGNYGNRLQNYALVKFCNEFNDVYATNIWEKSTKYIIKSKIKKIIPLERFAKSNNFEKFNKNIKMDKNINNKQYFIAGSDQIWNPNFAAFDRLLLKDVSSKNKISYAASIGLNELPENQKERFKQALAQFKAISVREDSGKKIVEELTGRKDIEVLVDPTMLLTSDEWDKVSKQPKQYNGEKYILNYFLGNLSESRKQKIEKIAEKYNWKIINILDKNDPYYVSGPSEFLWLEKHAELICTDSFHSSVFAILYNRPFAVFGREEKGMDNMGSRIDTLLSKFKLDNRRYNGKEITDENLKHDYTEAYKILEKEREKSKKFLEKALDIIE